MSDKYLESAFPVPEGSRRETGMTLRDYFASDALNGIIIHAKNHAGASMLVFTNGKSVDRLDFAKTAYEYADAMLIARDL